MEGTTLLADLLTAFASTACVGLIGYAATRWLAPLRPARFGGFMLAIGYASARFSGAGAGEAPLMRAIGAAAALGLLWFLWFSERDADRP